MKPGDIVKRNKKSVTNPLIPLRDQLGLFIGLKTSKAGYTYSEVMWFNERSPNGNIISTVQSSLLEVVSECR